MKMGIVIINPKMPKIVHKILNPIFSAFHPNDNMNIKTSKTTAMMNNGNRIIIPRPVNNPIKKLSIVFTSY